MTNFETETTVGPSGAGISRVVVGGLIPVACVAALVGPLVAFGDELPDRVASHFDTSGTPDGSMTPLTLLVTTGLTLVGPGIVMLIATTFVSRRMPRLFPPFLAGLGAFLAALGAGIMTQTVLGQRGIADWTEASGPGLGLAAVLTAATLAGVIAALVARNLPYNAASDVFATDVDGERPTMEIADGERVVYTETISPSWMLWLTAVVLAIATVLAFFTVWWVALIMLVTAVPLLMFSAMRVQADRDGLVVRSAILGFRFAKVKAEEIEQASVIDVEPLKWGGWGYRGSLKLAGTAAVVMRRGPGVHLKLSGDRVFVVTLDNPSAAAAVLNARVV